MKFSLKKTLSIAVFGLAFALPVMAQNTNEKISPRSDTQTNMSEQREYYGDHYSGCRGGGYYGGGHKRWKHEGRGYNRHGRGGYSASKFLLSPQEYEAHRNKMRSITTYEECQKSMADHNNLLEQRAKEKDIVLPDLRSNRCDVMLERGFIR